MGRSQSYHCSVVLIVTGQEAPTTILCLGSGRSCRADNTAGARDECSILGRIQESLGRQPSGPNGLVHSREYKR